MKSLLLVLIIIFVGVPNTPVLRQSAGEKIMQGTWILEGGGENKSPRWYLEWTFENGKFSLNGYPPIRQEGSYRVIKGTGDKLALELFDQKGNFGTEKSQIEVIVDANNDMLMIKGKGPYKRVYKKQGGY